MCFVSAQTDSLSRSLKRERPGSRSPSPPLADVPPPILQPYDGSLASSESNQRSVLPSPDPVPPKLEELETPFKEFNDYSPAYTNSNHNYNPPPPPPPLPPNCKADSIIDSAQVKKHNMNLRALAFKEIKKPGRSKYLGSYSSLPTCATVQFGQWSSLSIRLSGSDRKDVAEYL